MRRWRGLTWVGWLNYLVLRWFFVRLAYAVPSPEIGRPPTRWFLTRWVWPMPWSTYRHVGRAHGKTRPVRRAAEAQALDFAYGNLAASTNHKPSRSAFAKLAAKRGWSLEEFETWATAYKW